MLTVKDIKKIAKVFATKQDLEKFVTKEHFDRKYSKFMDKLDSVYKEVCDMRQEQVVRLKGAHDRIQEEVDMLKKRVDKVEAVVTS